MRRRLPVAVGVAPLSGAVLPHPDPWDSMTLALGAMKRFCTKTPDTERPVLVDFMRFVDETMEKELKPLPADTDVSFGTWIEEYANYSRQRKDELIALYENFVEGRWDPAWAKVKMFCKDEFYPEFKHGRGINSRSDEFKTLVGPVFAAIERELFIHSDMARWFIKKVPVDKRPQVVTDRLYRQGAQYFATDASSFEASFTEEIMAACEFRMYRYMTQYLPVHSRFMFFVFGVLGGNNEVINKCFSIRLRATRMSGEMCTSLGNGFFNLMSTRFLCHRIGTKVDGFVEGDDGLFRIEGRPPTKEEYASLGVNIKPVLTAELHKASFCGLVFDPSAMVVVTDPRKALALLGWVPGRYFQAKRSVHLSMIRAKAWSMGYQYTATPILSSAARAFLRVTRGFDHRIVLNDRNVSQWERAKFLEAFSAGRPFKDIGEGPIAVDYSTRMIMKEAFSVDISVQLAYERFFDSMTELTEIPDFFGDLPPSWFHMYQNYARTSSTLSGLFDNPPENWPVLVRIPVPIRLTARRRHEQGALDAVIQPP